MNDRYLYRAKRTDNGEWVEGDLVHSVYKINDTCVGKYGSNVGMHQVDESTVCQCTELKDKNGKMIWENDVLMGHGNPKDLVKAVFGYFYVIDVETLEKVDKVVGWHYEVIPTDAISKCEPFCIPMPLTDEYIERCEFEVIGNIFDNPELLEPELLEVEHE